MVMQLSRKRKLVANSISKADEMSFPHRSWLKMAPVTWTRMQNALAERGWWSQELIKVVRKWFVFREDKVDRGRPQEVSVLLPRLQTLGRPVLRRDRHGALRFIMESSAKS